MSKEKLKRKQHLDERSIIIPGKSIAKLKETKKLTHAELAALLGVNPATLSRWISDSEDMPTSTTFLVLIPLLLSVGEDLIPKYYDDAVFREYQSVFGSNETKKHADKLKQLSRERFLRANPDLQRARRLFHALQEAWLVLESQSNIEKK